MCMTSMVYDYGRQNPPWQNPDPGFTNPNHYRNPLQDLNDFEAREAIKRFLKLLDAAKEYDEATKQRDCEDADKAKFMTEVLDRLAAIEKRLSPSS